MFLDPFAAKTVLSSEHNITLIPLGMQRKVSAFPQILEKLYLKRTPEAVFARRLMSRLYSLQKLHPAYQHVDMFIGEILGAVVAGDLSALKSTFELKKLKVSATGVESEDGEISIDKEHGKTVKVLESVDPSAYYNVFAKRLGDKTQAAVIGSFNEQRRIWSTPSNSSNI